MITADTKYKSIGRLGKSFGLEGYIRVRLNKLIALQASTLLEKGKAVFVHIEAFKIPFIIADFNPEQELIQFQQVSPSQLEELLGCGLYLPEEALPELHPDAVDTDILVGFFIYDETTDERVGVIDRIEEYPAHPMAIVLKDEKEILIPLVEVWIRDIDPAEHILYLELPEGLIHSDEEE